MQADQAPPTAKLPRKPRSAPRRRTASKRKSPIQKPRAWGQRLATFILEIGSLGVVAVIAAISVVGDCADRFVGTSLVANVLPFALSLGISATLAGLALGGWWRLRQWFALRSAWAPPLLAACLAIGAGWYGSRDTFLTQLSQFRVLVGGPAEAERRTLAHQVYAAYRRTDLAQTRKMFDRALAFGAAIDGAARAFRLDRDVLVGIAATESSFLPRDSRDGGHGLFQITAVPQHTERLVKSSFGIATIDLNNPEHNALLAAATLREYVRTMRGDLFLGLLAYNIGPANGGLRSIMDHYGARDFVTIQPYLQNLPRDYPIRVLCFALAHRLWRQHGDLPRYEDGANAMLIQKIGIPGLNAG